MTKKKNSKERRKKQRRKEDKEKNNRIRHICKRLVQAESIFNAEVDALLEEHNLDRAELM